MLDSPTTPKGDKVPTAPETHTALAADSAPAANAKPTDSTAANHDLEKSGALPQLSIVGADHPSDAPSGAMAVASDLGKGAWNEITQHPGQVAESAAIGVGIGVVAALAAPEVGIGIAAAGIGYGAYELATHIGGWFHDAKVVADQKDYDQTQVAQAHQGLQGVGAGGVLVGAGFAGGYAGYAGTGAITAALADAPAAAAAPVAAIGDGAPAAPVPNLGDAAPAAPIPNPGDVAPPPAPGTDVTAGAVAPAVAPANGSEATIAAPATPPTPGTEATVGAPAATPPTGTESTVAAPAAVPAAGSDAGVQPAAPAATTGDAPAQPTPPAAPTGDGQAAPAANTTPSDSSPASDNPTDGAPKPTDTPPLVNLDNPAGNTDEAALRAAFRDAIQTSQENGTPLNLKIDTRVPLTDAAGNATKLTQADVLYQELQATDPDKAFTFSKPDLSPGDPGYTEFPAPLVTQDGLHISSSENMITLGQDTALPDGSTLPAGSKFSVGTTYDGNVVKSVLPDGKVWATTPDGQTVMVAGPGETADVPSSAMSSDPYKSGQVVNATTADGSPNHIIVRTNAKATLPDGTPTLDVYPSGGDGFDAAYKPGTEPGTVAPKAKLADHFKLPTNITIQAETNYGPATASGANNDYFMKSGFADAQAATAKNYSGPAPTPESAAELARIRAAEGLDTH